PQGQLLDPEAAQAVLDGLLEMGARAVRRPLAAVGAHVAALGGEDDAIADPELVQQGGDQLLVLTLRTSPQLAAGTVGVGGVAERDAGVEGGRDRLGQLLAWLGPGL